MRPVHAVDPHVNYHFGRFADTYDIALGNVTQHGLARRVQIVRARATESSGPRRSCCCSWTGCTTTSMCLRIFVTSRRTWRPAASSHFTTTSSHCPGVKRCVDELLLEGACEFVTHRDRLIVCRKLV
ncbi:MAG TPA: hypothetical protein VFT39_12770 [Vicinamibacterales bacterium]|nr:hypothetical protein [Vicinamibacterales bacterium]